MQISVQETRQASKRSPRSLAPCVITSSKTDQLGAYFARVCSHKEDKYVSGWSRREAVSAAVAYAVDVLGYSPNSIEYGDRFRG